MDSQRFQRIAEVFELVRTAKPADREEALGRACGGDESLRREVLDLLSHHDEPSSPLDVPIVQQPFSAQELSAAAAAALPKRIGRYEIVRLLGEGGMGAVYEARQENPRRTVALKVIHWGYVTPAMLRRFEHEAQILGRLQHPGIAQIFEAGTFDAGSGPQPYFAMEYVDGVPINRYVERHGLGTRERLTLIARVADAVQHAHQKGVIHRDLKPGNILVDSTGQPKVLDFGVARATDGDIQLTTLRTDIGQLVGTIPYMSPEQAAGDADALDTRSDVYALGVLAYELLAGRLPYDLQRKLVHEAVRVIREEEPTRLSSIDRTFRGDIETIVGKALEKDRARRYQAASDLAEDIRRYLRDEAVIARPPSRSYVLRKFAKRHKALVGGVLAVFIVLVAGIVATTLAMLKARDAEDVAIVQKIRAQKEKDAADAAEKVAQEEKNKAKAAEAEAIERKEAAERAKEAAAAAEAVAIERKEFAEGETKKAAAAEKLAEDRLAQVEKEKAKADAVVSFQQEMLASVDPRLAGTNRDITVREVLDEAAKKLDAGSLKDQPEVEGAVRYAVGMTYFSLGYYPEAVRHLQRSVELRRQVLGNEHLETAESLAMLGETYREMSKLASAEPLAREALAIRERLAPETATHADSLNNVALVEKGLGHWDECEKLNERALAIRRKVRGDVHDEIMQSLNNLAMVAWDGRNDIPRAVKLLEECLDVGRKLYQGDNLYVANSMQNLAQVYEDAGEIAKAVAMMRDALQMRRNVLGDEHDLVGESMNNLAAMLKRKGDLSEAEPLYLKSLEIRRKSFGPDDRRVSESLNNLGTLYNNMGRCDEAEKMAREAIAVRRKSAPGDHPMVALYLANLASTLTVCGKLDEAEKVTIEAVEMRRRLGESRTPNFAAGLLNYASLKREQGDLAGAESLQREALEIIRSQALPPPVTLANILNNLGGTLREQGKLDESLEMLEEGMEIRRSKIGPETLPTAISLQNVALLYVEKGRLEEAESLLRKAIDIRRANLPEGHLDTGSGLLALGKVLMRAKKPAEAEPYLREGLAIRRAKLSSGHARIAEAAGELGALLLDDHRLEEAEPLLREAAAGVMDAPSSLPSLRRTTAERMIALCEAIGKPDEAAAWRERRDSIPATTQPASAPAAASQP